jgi:hypothetical protein
VLESAVPESESPRPAAEMQQPLRSTRGALDPDEAVHRVPAIEKRLHDTLRRSAQRPAGLLESLFIGADKVLPVVIEDLVGGLSPKMRARLDSGRHNRQAGGLPRERRLETLQHDTRTANAGVSHGAMLTLVIP